MADRYWVGGSATWNSTATAVWSTTSGGAGGASVPTITDNVIFNAASGNVDVVANGTALPCNVLDFRGFTGAFIPVGPGLSGTVRVAGNVTLSSTMRAFGNSSAAGNVAVGATSTFISNGVTIGMVMICGNASATYVFSDNVSLLANKTILGTGGNVNMKDITVNIGANATIDWTGTGGARTINYSNSIINIQAFGGLRLRSANITANMIGATVTVYSNAALTINTSATANITNMSLTLAGGRLDVGAAVITGAGTANVIPFANGDNASTINGNWPSITIKSGGSLRLDPVSNVASITVDGGGMLNINASSATNTLTIPTLLVAGNGISNMALLVGSLANNSRGAGINSASMSISWAVIRSISFTSAVSADNSIATGKIANVTVTEPSALSFNPVRRNR